MVPSNLVSSGGAQDTGKIDNIQDFWCKFGMKPHIYLAEIINFYYIFNNSVTVRPNKVMLRVDKNWAHFLKILQVS